MDHASQTTVRGRGSWLTLAVFVTLSLLAGALLFATPTERQQVALNDLPLPFEHVIPPITQPTAP